MLIGLVGVPNSGKSTFFKSATLADIEIANYPFTTIEPNQGVAHITAPCPCKMLGVKCNPQNSACVDGVRHIPVKLLDVAGLVPGAHEGKGLGNQFLDDLRQADGLIHVLDISGKTDAEGKENEWDPSKTIEILENEIDEWIYGIIQKNYIKSKRIAEMEKKPIERMLAQNLSGLGIEEHEIKAAMRDNNPDEREFTTTLRKISKPIIIAANKIDKSGAKEIFEKVRESSGEMISCSADSELALREADKHGLINYKLGSSDFTIASGNLNEKQKAALEFIRSNVLKRFGTTGVQKILNKMVFEKLGYVTVYPVADINHATDKKGNILPDVFLVKKGTTLKELASKVHSDMADKFIGGMEYKTKRKIGAEQKINDGDVIEIIFGK
ncbi:MAG: redox-regulated ATPase YchF [Candidatus Aenigmarchaeota archaeon]|nr:redox-regulated ATPase YchF [Candidatus Aenigmarchaeota archaeon]